MKGSPAVRSLPTPARRALVKLGEDLSAARRRRRISMEIMAERAFITRRTLGRVERGDPSVSMGIYTSVLFVLGMADRIGALVDATTDRLGVLLEDKQLPKRIRARSSP